MKNIEDIERLSLEELERISLDETIPVPEGLEERITLPEKSGSRRLLLRIAGIAASLVLIGGLAFTLRPKPLQDTFDDPALAYAQIEKALLMVSGEMEIGVNSVAKSAEILRKPTEAIHLVDAE